MYLFVYETERKMGGGKKGGRGVEGGGRERTNMEVRDNLQSSTM